MTPKNPPQRPHSYADYYRMTPTPYRTTRPHSYTDLYYIYTLPLKRFLFPPFYRILRNIRNTLGKRTKKGLLRGKGGGIYIHYIYTIYIHPYTPFYTFLYDFQKVLYRREYKGYFVIMTQHTW